MGLRVEECRRLLNPRNIFELLPREVFEELVRGLFHGFERNVVLLWAEYEEWQNKWVVKNNNRVEPHRLVDKDRPPDFSIFCWELRKIVGPAHCLTFDRDIAQQYVDGVRVEPGPYKCWAKLNELAYPLRYGGKVRAVLLAGGQFIPSDQTERDMIREEIVKLENGEANWEKVQPFLNQEIQRQAIKKEDMPLERIQERLGSLGLGLQRVIDRAYESRLDRAMRVVQKDLQDIFARADLSSRETWWQDVGTIFPDFCNAMELDKIFVLSCRLDHFEQITTKKDGEVEIGRIALKESTKIGEKNQLVYINNEQFEIAQINSLSKSGDCWAYRTELKADVINVSTLLIVKGVIPDIHQSFVEDFCRIVTGPMDMASMIFQIQDSKQQQEKTLGRLTHELRGPITAIKGATESIIETPGSKRFFDFDYPGDIWSWTDLMTRVIDNADVYRYVHKGEMDIRPEKVFLLTDVVAPAIRQVRLLLKARGFSPRNITYIGFEKFPELWLDRNRFQQIVFNLLSNSIKYAYDDREMFEVEIEGIEKGEYFCIYVRDWGPGIETEESEKVFEEEFRGEKAIDMNVTGQGLGLWIVKQIVEMHGGRTRVSNSHQPTEIEIQLPYWLIARAPCKKDS